MSDGPTTRLCRSTATDIIVGGRSLPGELMGQRTFTEMTYAQVVGRDPTPGQTAVVDACLVTLMEHGLTPTAISTRLTYTSAPEAMQGAVAAGLLGVGSLFVGTLEGCALLLERIVAAADREAETEAIVAEHRAARRPLPGFGHPQHTPDDPRSPVLLAIAAEHGVAGDHVEALRLLSQVLDARIGRHLTINATGAVAAVLLDARVPARIVRGFALISRCAGLVAHIREEQEQSTLRELWHAAEAAVPYLDPEEAP